MSENISFSIGRVRAQETSSPDRKLRSSAQLTPDFGDSENTAVFTKSPGKQPNASSKQSSPTRSPSGLSEISLNSPKKLHKRVLSPLQSYLQMAETEESSPTCEKAAQSKVEISWVAIDFGNVQCGRTLGSCISFTSKSKQTLHAKLNIDKKTEHFSGAELGPIVNKEDYISQSTKNEFISKGATNFQMKHKSWYLEEPKTKELASSLTVAVKPKQSANVIVVLRTPERCSPGSILAAMVDIKFSDRQSSQTQRVFLFGRIEKFPVVFPKEVCTLMNPTRVIPIAFKYSAGQAMLAQKFKLPMKNQNLDKQIQISFTPMRNNAAPQPLSKCFEIFVIPGSVSIPAGGSGFVNLMIKMNLDATGKRSIVSKGEKVLKAIVANAKQSSLVYGLFIEILLIQAAPALSNEE